MSTNHKIRQIADRLPQVPKLHNDKVQRDSQGKIIMLNHFREIKEIYDKCGNNIQRRNMLCENYVKACYEYDELLEKETNKVIRKAWAMKIAEILLGLVIVAGIIRLLWHHLQ